MCASYNVVHVYICIEQKFPDSNQGSQMANNGQQTRNHPLCVEPARVQYGNGEMRLEAINRERTANNLSASVQTKLETSTKKSSTSNESPSKDQNSDSDESEIVKEKTD